MVLDGNGVAAVIGAGVAGVVSFGTFVMQVISWFDQRELRRKQEILAQEGAARAEVINQVKAMVNGRLGELKMRIAKEAFEMGRHFQRDNGDASSPEFPLSKADEYLDAVGQASAVSQDARAAAGGTSTGQPPAAAPSQAPVSAAKSADQGGPR